MNKAQALYNFWSGFGVPAYDSQSVPTGENAPEMPYITYETMTDSIGFPIAMTASLWYRSTSWQAVTLKADEISDAIDIGGKVIALDDGYLWITRGTPFAQRLGDDADASVKRIVINIMAEYLTAN